MGATPDDLADLSRQLDETIYAVLADAGIPVRPSDDGPFRPDSYFDASESEQDRSIVSLDLTRLRQDQESVVITTVADGLSPVEWEALETLVTDGGQVAPKDIAAENGRHLDSVYDALGRMDDLIEHEYGDVRLRSNHIAEVVHEAVEQARDATRDAIEATAKAAETAKRGVDETTSALIAWCAKHGIDVDDRSNARLTLRMNGVENVEARLSEA